MEQKRLNRVGMEFLDQMANENQGPMILSVILRFEFPPSIKVIVELNVKINFVVNINISMKIKVNVMYLVKVHEKID